MLWERDPAPWMHEERHRNMLMTASIRGATESAPKTAPL